MLKHAMYIPKHKQFKQRADKMSSVRKERDQETARKDCTDVPQERSDEYEKQIVVKACRGEWSW
jgi:hypothetical protein